MRHGQSDNEKSPAVRKISYGENGLRNQDFVLEKSIFNNVFEKDIRRVYIYKKAERLGKALQLIIPAFTHSPSLKARFEAIAVSLVDAAILPPGSARHALSKELLALSSLLAMARTGGFLSPMNSELIAREAQLLLQEAAGYEDPRVQLEEVATLSALSRGMPTAAEAHEAGRLPEATDRSKGHQRVIKDNMGHVKDRRDAILSIIRSKGSARIKDISMVVRGVSEKTIQRELHALIGERILRKEGERRWSTYKLAE